MQIAQATFIDWITFLPSKLRQEIRNIILIQKPSVQIPKAFDQHGIAGRTKNYLGANALI